MSPACPRGQHPGVPQGAGAGGSPPRSCVAWPAGQGTALGFVAPLPAEEGSGHCRGDCGVSRVYIPISNKVTKLALFKAGYTVVQVICPNQ